MSTNTVDPNQNFTWLSSIGFSILRVENLNTIATVDWTKLQSFWIRCVNKYFSATKKNRCSDI